MSENPTLGPASGCAACAATVAPMLFCHHLKILNHFIPKLRTVSEVHWDNQACVCTEETGAI